MAMSIAVGFVVDDAIVMLEVVWRRVEEGEEPFQAALNGAKEVGFTILTISISLIAVFTPLVFMGGVVGRLMSEFAITLSAAVAVSIFLSLTLTPTLCGQFLRRPEPLKNPVLKAVEQGFKRLEAGYAGALDVVLRHTGLTLVVFLVTAGLAVVLYIITPTGFFPQQDTGIIRGVIVTSEDASFEKMQRKIDMVGKVLGDDPDVLSVGFFLGGNTSQANAIVSLKPRDEGRKASSDEILTRLRPRLAKLVGVQTFLQSSQDINVGGRAGRAQYQYTLADANLDELNAWAPRLEAALQKLPELKDVSSDQQSHASAVVLDIDRQAAGRFGIAASDIDAAVYDLLGQRQVAQYFTQLNAYHVVLEAPPKQQLTPEILSTVRLMSPLTGKTVPLSLFVKVRPNQTAALQISHQGQFPAATLSFNLTPGVSLGQATEAVEKARAELGAPLPLIGSFQGTAQAFQESLGTEPILIAAALLAVYIILGILYESYIHPLTILSTLPSAGLGALLALILIGQDLNVIGIIAILLLIGIVKKNGIMIVDVALRLEREHDLVPREAVAQASHLRLRPILMTTACALFGALPMILIRGTGSEFRQPLGWAIAGGLLVSQVLTLFTTPVVYVYLDRLRKKAPQTPQQEAA
jgi:HAE1 family hydrophobic/amphiphilic exporter-1